MQKYEKLLGTAGLNALAKHWKNYGHLMEKISSEEIQEYALTSETPEQTKTIREGILKMAEAYQACFYEVENKNKANE